MAMLSFSQMASELRCEYQAHAYYIEGWRRRAVPRAPSLGTATHLGLAAYWRGQDWGLAISTWHDEQLAKLEDNPLVGVEELDEKVAMLEDICGVSMVLVRRTMDNMHGWEPVWRNGQPIIEQPFTCSLPGWEGYLGYVDAVMEAPDGSTWIVDWKTRESIPEPSEVDLSLQKPTYQYVLAQNGIDTTGSMIVSIKSSIPKEPKINKDGSVSRAACDTTWEIYSQAVKRSGGNPDDYLEMRDKLRSKVWIQFDRAPRTKETINNIWNDVVVPVADRIRTRRAFQVQPLRNYGSFHCKTCWFLEPCTESLRGRDPHYILTHEFENVNEMNERNQPEEEIFEIAIPDPEVTRSEN